MPSTSPSRRRFLGHAAGAAAAGLAWPATGFAQGDAYPARPVKVVCNFPAGSSPDALVRAISVPMQQTLGQPVVIDNRAGASGMIGAELVAKAPADGYTLLMTAGSTITTNPHVFAKMPFDPARDLVPVAALARLNLFLVTRGDFPASNVREFLAYLKKHPGKVTYGSAGNATGLHLAGEMLKGQAGVFAVHVPYRGASLALQDLLAGQIDFYFDPGIALQQVKAGRLKLLAVGAPQRSPLYPDVPTLAEAGLPGFDAGTTHGLYAPAGTPAAIVERLNHAVNAALVQPNVKAQIATLAEAGLPGFDAGTTHGLYAPAGTPAAVVERLNHAVNAALAQPNVKAQIATLAAEPTPMTPAQFETVMREDSRRYGAVIRERHITAT